MLAVYKIGINLYGHYNSSASVVTSEKQDQYVPEERPSAVPETSVTVYYVSNLFPNFNYPPTSFHGRAWWWVSSWCWRSSEDSSSAWEPRTEKIPAPSFYLPPFLAITFSWDIGACPYFYHEVFVLLIITFIIHISPGSQMMRTSFPRRPRKVRGYNSGYFLNK